MDGLFREQNLGETGLMCLNQSAALRVSAQVHLKRYVLGAISAFDIFLFDRCEKRNETIMEK